MPASYPFAWPTDRAALEAAQDALALAVPPEWTLPDGPVLVAGCALVSSRGAAGAGASGDPGWAAAVLLEVGSGPPREVSAAELAGRLGAAFEPGLLALREGPLLEAAVAALTVRPEVLMIHAAGRDHPRRAGLAVMLGLATGLASVGVTTRPLVARGPAGTAGRPPHPGPLPRWGRGENMSVARGPDGADRLPHAAWVRREESSVARGPDDADRLPHAAWVRGEESSVARGPDDADRLPHAAWVRGEDALDALVLDGEVVAYRVRTRPGVRRIVAHAGWRTTAETAAALVLRAAIGARTPEPIRRALERARSLRALHGVGPRAP